MGMDGDPDEERDLNRRGEEVVGTGSRRAVGEPHLQLVWSMGEQHR